MSLNKIFNPKSIAVVGASGEKGSVGYDLFRNIAHSKYKGKVYPVNYKRKKVQGKPAYKNVSAIGLKVDLVIIATPAKTVPGIVAECAAIGIKALLIISAGFNEAGSEGKILSEEIKVLADKHKISIIGPNCLGFLHPAINLNASFAVKNAKKGKIAFISQSGALCTSILDWAEQANVGFSHFVSIGSMLNVCFADLIEYFAKDKETEAIIVYMESVINAQKFIKVSRKISPKKPIIVLKVGRSSAGSMAAKSHTGSLTGDDRVFDVAFEACGIERVYTITDLFNCAKILSMRNIPSGGKLSIITNAGGPGVISTDKLITEGGKIAKLSPSTKSKLDEFLPASWSHSNPIDILGDATPERYAKAIKTCLQEKDSDALFVLLTPQSMTDPLKVAKELVSASKKTKKPIFSSWMGAGDVREGIEFLSKNNIPFFRNPENAIISFMHICKQKSNALEAGRKDSSLLFFENNSGKQKNEKIIEKLKKQKRKVFLEHEAKEFLSNYGIKSPKNFVAKSAREAGDIADENPFPFAMKIISPQILHKIDTGGVKLAVEGRKQAETAYKRILKNAKNKNPQAKIEGVFMEKMAEKGYEVLLGCKYDPLFGHIIVFGSGGSLVELYNDINISLLPNTQKDIENLIDGTKISQVLKGYRSMESIDLKYLIGLVGAFSGLIKDFPSIKEMDINPLRLYKNNSSALDVKIIMQ